MGYNAKKYFEYEERLLEPDSVIITGNAKRHEPAWAAKNKWLNSLTPEQREQLAKENGIKYKNYND